MLYIVTWMASSCEVSIRWSSKGFMHIQRLLQGILSSKTGWDSDSDHRILVGEDGCRGLGWGLVRLFFKWTWARQLPETELQSSLRSTVVGCVLLSDVLQDIKDELHHKRLVASLAPPAGYDGSQHVIQGVQVLGRERLPIAPSHKPHLKKQIILFQSLLEFTRVALLKMSEIFQFLLLHFRWATQPSEEMYKYTNGTSQWWCVYRISVSPICMCLLNLHCP